MSILKNQPTIHEFSEDFLQHTTDAFVKVLVKKKIGVTGYLAKSFVDKVIGSIDSVEKLEIAFAFYGRYRDMGVRRGVSVNDVRKNKAKYTAKAAEHKLLSAKRTKRQPKLDGKWYNKTLSGRLKDLNKMLQEYYQVQGVDFVGSAFKYGNIQDIQL